VHLVLKRVERGEHEDRRRDPGRAQSPADLPPVEVGQQQIENDQLARPGPRAPDRLEAAACDVDAVAFRLEPAPHELDDALVVLNQQQAHRPCPRR
jgi:hypothetical protein